MRIYIIFITYALIFINVSNLFSQHINYPLGFNYNIVISKEINKSENNIHSAFKPLRKYYIDTLTKADSVVYQINFNKNLIKKMPLKWAWRKLLDEDFIKLETKDLQFYVNPLLDYHIGNLKDDTTKYLQNTRGFQVFGNIGDKLSFYSDFFENQAFFIPYINNKIEQSLVVPGQGAWKVFQTTGRDYAMASGYLSFTPAKFLNIQFGHGKHFIGEGYRSLLLSDNAFNYPFIKVEFTWRNFKYSSMFTEFNDFYTKYYLYHYKKHGTFNYLSFTPNHRIEIGLYEAIIWKTSDDSTYVKKFPVSYFNPIILTRLFQYGLNNENNMLLGLNLKIKPSKYTQIYAQYILDNINIKDFTDKTGSFENKFGYQIGAKVFDIFHGYLKKQSLYLHAEYNYVRPYTYSNTNVRQAFTHYNQELAHPLGSGFKEAVFIVNYSVYNFYFQFKFNSAITSTDTSATNFGTDIFKSNNFELYNINLSNNEIGQGNLTNIKSQNITFGYIFNHRTYLQIFGSILKRNFKSTNDENNIYFVTFGLKTSISNFYYDF